MTDLPLCRRQLWRPQKLVRSPWLRWAIVLAVLVYLYFGITAVSFDPARVARGMTQAMNLLRGFTPPDFISRGADIRSGILESLAITFAATVLGIILAIPIALGAARNLCPLPAYILCRAIVTFARSFQEVVIGIFFVALFGFGPFAGVLTLAFAGIGFLAKLLAEEIETVEPETIDAIRATGASWLQVVTWAILPRVAPRFIGLSLYRLDINFRESAIIGVVGAGGIGATLNTSFSRYEYDSAAAILILIVAIVFICEVFSGYIRKAIL